MVRLAGHQPYAIDHRIACCLVLAAAAAFAIALLVVSACSSSSVAVDSPSSVKCQVNVTNSMTNAPPDGANGRITIATTRDCTWTVTSEVAWIVVTSGSSGQGDGSAAYRVSPNPDTAVRRGTVQVNSTQIPISQDAACRYDVSPLNATVSEAGGTVTVAVQAGSSCGWTAQSGTSWISIAGAANGTGDGSVRLDVDANSGSARAGTVTVAGQTVTIAQAAATPTPCDISLSSSSQSIASSGGTSVVSVTTPATCHWTATSDSAWITITAGASGTGSDEVRYSVSANPGTSSRQGTIRIGNRPLTVTQAGPACTYAIEPTSQMFGSSGGNGSVAITAGAGCAWSASSTAAWITLSGSSSGTGNGSVTYRVAANSGVARSGSLTIAGQAFTVTQSSGCTVTISPTSQSVPASGGPGTVTVTAGTGCAWTATSDSTWIVITSGAAGTGNGAVAFTVAANPASARTGTLTIGGQTLTVNQAAFVCSYSLAPTSQSFTAAGGTGTVSVTTTSVCVWTAVSNDPWITVTSGASGIGNGTVGYSVAPNAGNPRNGTMTVGEDRQR